MESSHESFTFAAHSKECCGKKSAVCILYYMFTFSRLARHDGVPFLWSSQIKSRMIRICRATRFFRELGNFSDVFFRQFADCLSEKCYICHKEVVWWRLLLKWYFYFSVQLPFLFFLINYLGQYWCFWENICVFALAHLKTFL